MNGRVYDYNLGRFLSVDPFIQDPGNSQSLNPYSYIMNNPLAGTDPSGYAFFLAPLAPIAIEAIGSSLALWGAYETGDAIGTAAYEVGSGQKSLGEAAYNASVDLVINAGISITGAKLAKLVPNSLMDRANNLVDKALGNSNGVGHDIPNPDGNFSADLSKTKAKSRSGHSNAGNKQHHDKMTEDPNFRREQEEKWGDDVYDRTSTKPSGRRNPKNAEWDHNSEDPNILDLRSKKNHLQKTKAEGQTGGGFKKFHKKSKTKITSRSIESKSKRASKRASASNNK